MNGWIALPKRGWRGSPSDRDAGASPLFPPEHEASPTAKEALERVVRRDPRQFGIDRTRWRLLDLLAQCPAWAVTTPAGMAGILQRLEISYQRGRDYVHSPDPAYDAKMAQIATLLAETRACTDRLVTLYLDELTYYRQPTVAPAYAPHTEQPRARRSHQANTPTRVVAGLNALSGKVLAWQGSKVDVPQLVRFFRQLRQGYPEAERLYVVLDNWPVHFHPDVLVALEPQESPFPRYRPPSWPDEPSEKARKKWGAWHLPIQLVPLPTSQQSPFSAH
jgi:hypothetical protein